MKSTFTIILLLCSLTIFSQTESNKLSKLKVHLDDLVNTNDSPINDTIKYRFDKAYIAGMKIKMRGGFNFVKDTIIMINDATSYSGEIELKIPLNNKVKISDNNWKIEYSKMGVSGIIEYNADSTKYNSNGGFIKLIIAGVTTTYPLDKVY